MRNQPGNSSVRTFRLRSPLAATSAPSPRIQRRRGLGSRITAALRDPLQPFASHVDALLREDSATEGHGTSARLEGARRVWPRSTMPRGIWAAWGAAAEAPNQLEDGPKCDVWADTAGGAGVSGERASARLREMHGGIKLREGRWPRFPGDEAVLDAAERAERRTRGAGLCLVISSLKMALEALASKLSGEGAARGAEPDGHRWEPDRRDADDL